MLEIRNKGKSPVQLLVRSKKSPNSFTPLNIPGIGKGKNTILLEDERIIPEILDRLKKLNLISTKYIPNTSVKKVATKQRVENGD